ncbi:MAG TPA: DNA oxidative demethylase AlkB, partial [Terriglobales bacterium]|nr:DNA oxidative demethylase AlkB [Terriglobales bacterium]
DLFAAPEASRKQELAPGAFLLRGFGLADEAALLAGLREVTVAAPFRHMLTPGGHRMSVAMTNCGEVGWVTDRSGYRYTAVDPETSQRWPAMPGTFRRLAATAAAEADFANFCPDACLINRYEIGAKMSLHQDKDEQDFMQPIVSVSLGLPAVFQFGGTLRSDEALRVPLAHGDMVVWGGPARLRFHAILSLKEGEHALLGRQRINLTFRKAG